MPSTSLNELYSLPTAFQSHPTSYLSFNTINPNAVSDDVSGGSYRQGSLQNLTQQKYPLIAATVANDQILDDRITYLLETGEVLHYKRARLADVSDIKHNVAFRKTSSHKY